MTASELIQKQLSESEYMLGKTLEGLDETTAESKHANLMTPKETVGHLCEAYLAAKAHADGEKFSWGVYQPNPFWNALLEDFKTTRAQAIETLLAKGDDDSLVTANAYLVAHDQYHIGQLCAVRIAMDPEWDPYSIYA